MLSFKFLNSYPCKAKDTVPFTSVGFLQRFASAGAVLLNLFPLNIFPVNAVMLGRDAMLGKE